MSLTISGILGLTAALAADVRGASPAPSFADMMQTMRAFQESRVLLTAVELDIFTAVGGGSTAERVSNRLKADKRATETLLNALVAMGAMTKKDVVYRNSPAAAQYLVEGSPDDARSALMHTVHLWPAWSALTECVRAGTSVTYKEMADREQPWMRDFIAAMHRNAMGQAPALVEMVGAKGVRRLLDVGGGSGAYAIAFARASSTLRAEVLDLPPVVPIARRHIDEAGLQDRVTTRIGDLRMDEFGEAYDLVLLSAICHMLSPEENRDLLRRCYRALATGGRLVIRDFILEPGKTAPRSAALFALNMLVGTQGGSTYSGEEYTAWLREAGFAKIDRLSEDLIVAARD